jgi:hypothetical protein
LRKLFEQGRENKTLIACPNCDHEATQVWYCVERDGQIVPLKPVLDDGVWHCAACYNEFEVATRGSLTGTRPSGRAS